MRLFKLFLIVLLVLVSVLYGFTTLSSRMSGANVPPTIECPQDTLEISVNAEEAALLADVTAKDKQDGDLTGRIQIQGISKLITNDTARVTYLVFDSHGNMASTSRMIRYTDYEDPIFSISTPLIYTNTQQIGLLDRLHAQDVIDGDITNLIRVNNPTATGDPEIYMLSAQVTNSMGSTSQITLPLIMYSSTETRAFIELSDYLIYLDQGSAFNPRSYLVAVETRHDDGDVREVKTEGQVDTSTPGTYIVYYRYAYEGTTALNTLTVVVQ